MKIYYNACVNIPLREDWVIDNAMHEFTRNNAFLFCDWHSFRTDISDYKERWDMFKSRIKVDGVFPTVGVKDGWYRVTSVIVKMSTEV